MSARLFLQCAALVITWAANQPECGGELVGIIKGDSDPRNCSYIHIQYSGKTFPSEQPFTGCGDVTGQSDGIPRTASFRSGHQLFFMTGSGANIFSVHFSDGAQTVFATLPAMYNFTIGMQYVTGAGLFILTTGKLYIVPEVSRSALAKAVEVMDVSSLGLTEDAVLSGNNDVKILYVADKESLFKLDVSAKMPVVSIIQMETISKAMDLAVYTPNGVSGPVEGVLVLESYKLYLVDADTGKTSFLLDIPDGSGFPRVNDIFTTTFFFCDFDKLYTVDIPSKTVLTNATFNGALLQGYFQWHP